MRGQSRVRVPRPLQTPAVSRLGPGADESQVWVLFAQLCCSREIKHRHVGWASRLFKVFGVSLGRSKDPIDDESIRTHAVKEKASSCDEVTRVCLPGPKGLARLRDEEVDGMITIEMHFDSIFPDCTVGLDAGIVWERPLVHAPADGLDVLHDLANVSSGRDNHRALRFDSTASKNGQPVRVLVE